MFYSVRTESVGICIVRWHEYQLKTLKYVLDISHITNACWPNYDHTKRNSTKIKNPFESTIHNTLISHCNFWVKKPNFPSLSLQRFNQQPPPFTLHFLPQLHFLLHPLHLHLNFQVILPPLIKVFTLSLCFTKKLLIKAPKLPSFGPFSFNH